MTVKLDESLTGRLTRDPMTGAFSRKETAHIQVMGNPVLAEDQADCWQSLLRNGPSDGPRLAYLHIPFCRTRCSYCAFFQNRSSDDKIAQYLKALHRELAMAADQAALTGAPFDAIYVGGGTPSDLSPQQILELGQRIRDTLPLRTDAELTFEARFHGFDQGRFQACLDAGFNRFSLGVQSFNTELRRRLGRIDDGDTVLRALERMCNQDQAVIVADLIYGLPGQTLADWQRDLNTLVDTGVGGADLYQLILLPESQLGRAVNKGRVAPPPGTAEKAAMFEAGLSTLARHHFNRLSVSHFGRDRRERNRYNHLSKAGAELIPFGAGGGGRIQSHGIMLERQLCRYLERIEAGEKPIAMMTQPHEEQGLRYAAGAGFDLGYLDLDRLYQRSDRDLADDAAPLFQAWQNHGLVERDGRYLNLTKAGQFWHINLQQGLNRYLDALNEQQQQARLNTMSDLYQRIHTLSQEQPMASLAQVGRQLGLSELATVQALPQDQARLVDGRHFDRLMAALTDFGPTTTVIEVAGQILEYKGGFPEGRYGHGFYNLQGEHLRGHLDPKAVSHIAFVRRPFMRLETRSLWLLNGEGQCSFKIYLGRDDKRQLLTEQVAKFDALEAELLALDADMPPAVAATAEAIAIEVVESDAVPRACPISGIQLKPGQQLSPEQDAQVRQSRCPMKRLLGR
ncbi:heme anaerobic degradation radical SAM methyltransferase ChuW/HutW [Ferrimonas balearica]|uniref:heme anaerobic degradation radical SAM methyltransferase ChuW/HutW n=1 Tax=Ferrimonas balearica TaxID=44012 RepID=UPI001C5673F3|nr:heme anaerobic degradation radical SAM methyltransferase ChuW/HutW [Ferrimonas balearica]MBW3141098.1 heme anaerobic degradation radical SAM methyltransferase ChuW/HutW [Ferrimonas balearica]